jgi:hypothetical protein
MQYIPLEDVRVTIGVEPVDVLKVEPGLNSLSADFLLRDDTERALRVNFDCPTIVRLLDDMPLSTEQHPSELEGIVPYHFAYEVRGHPFLLSQSPVWTDQFRPTHYQFLTGDGCMDVLAPGQPKFCLVPLDKEGLARRNERESDIDDYRPMTCH